MGYGLWVMGYGLWVMGYGLWVMGYGLWVMGKGYGLWVKGQQKVSDYIVHKGKLLMNLHILKIFKNHFY
jgi:hypothetical protein